MRLHPGCAVRHWGTYLPNMLAVDGDGQLTYGQIDRGADFLATRLQVLGDTVTHVILLIRDKGLFVSALVACTRTRRLFVPIDHASPDRFAAVLRCLCRCACIVTDNPNLDPAFLSNVKRIAISNDIFQVEYTKVEQRRVRMEDEAAVIFTSGTTSTPKGVVRNHYSLLSEAIQWIVELRMTTGCRFLIARPFFYTGGFVLMYSTLFVGGTIVTCNDNRVLDLCDKISFHPCDIAFLVPAQIHELLDTIPSRSSSFAKMVLTMGAPIAGQVKRRFAERYGCTVVESWGNSEGLGTITSAEDVLTRPDSIGRVFFCDTLSITDSQGNSKPLCEIGVLSGYSDNQYEYYLDRPTDPMDFEAERLLLSEDVGFQDDKGYFHILGRESERVIVNGHDVFPPNIEKRAIEHDAVADCAVTATSNAGERARLIIMVVPKSPLTEAEMREWINCRLSAHEQVSEVLFVSSIPRNQGGKIIRDSLSSLIRGSAI